MGFFLFFFFFKQKTAYEMRISDWSSDVCSSDLAHVDRMAAHRAGIPGLQYRIDMGVGPFDAVRAPAHQHEDDRLAGLLKFAEQRLQIGRASCRERVGQYG